MPTVSKGLQWRWGSSAEPCRMCLRIFPLKMQVPFIPSPLHCKCGPRSINFPKLPANLQMSPETEKLGPVRCFRWHAAHRSCSGNKCHEQRKPYLLKKVFNHSCLKAGPSQNHFYTGSRVIIPTFHPLQHKFLECILFVRHCPTWWWTRLIFNVKEFTF